MKFHQDDPRLTAYVLGELSPEEAARIEYAVAADPALRLAVTEIERSQSRLQDAFGGDSEKLLPRQKAAIMRAAKEATRQGKVVELKSHRKARGFWFWPVAAAAVVALGIFIMTLIPDPNGKGGARQVSGTGEDDSAESVRTTDDGEVLKLPLEAGNRSLALVSNAVRTEGRMPDKEDVRIGELLNAFPLQAKASVALWKDCALGSEVLPCPWKPSSSLVLVHVRSARETSRRITVEYRENNESVIASRVLGYRTDGTGSGADVSRTMEPGEEILLAILIDAKGADLGSLVWSVDGETAPDVSLEKDADSEATEDARFAALVCGFGLWLRGEETELIDDAMLLAMAREAASETLVPDRYDFLELVDQAVKLKD